MQAESFYTSNTKGAIPLHFVTKNTWAQALDSLTAAEQNCIVSQRFNANTGEVALVFSSEGQITKVFIGMAHEQAFTAAVAVAALRLPPNCYYSALVLTKPAQLAWGLAQYRFSTYKKTPFIARQLVVEEALFPELKIDLAAIFLVRDLINLPPNDLGPKELAQRLERLAQENDAHFEQWVGEELLKHNFPAIHAVGRAAAQQPRLLSLIWGNELAPKVTLIGKGVCFDSGGLDIKFAAGMRLMKKDMGGAAHVMGLAQWIMTQGLDLRVEVLIPCVENAIGPEAFRPGDILTMRNGLTVEIDNTDAEGRLILADALAKACEEKPELIIDFSTLTGAARVAVGTEIAALFTNNEQLAQELSASSLEVDDPLWRLPLFTPYESMLDSPIADLVNASASSYAGAITAALFLQRFISGDIAWAHLDIMAWNLSSKPGKPEGGEAMALRAVAHYLLKTYGKNA